MKTIEIIKQSLFTKSECYQRLTIFGKEIFLKAESDNFRVVLHEDFPMISESDLNDFVTYSIKKNKIIISGYKSKIHPYRLMYIDDDGYDHPFAKVDQEVRGCRHSYPDIYSFIPALAAIPPNTSIDFINRHENIDMYVMPTEKLLDNSSLIDRIMIMSLKRGYKS